MYCLSDYIEIRISSKYCYEVVISLSVTTRGECPPAGREESEDSQQQSNDFLYGPTFEGSDTTHGSDSSSNSAEAPKLPYASPNTNHRCGNTHHVTIDASSTITSAFL